MKWILMPLLAATLCGCSTVVSTRPMGEAPLDLNGEADKWTGTWRSPMGICTLTVGDATNGVLTMTLTSQKGWWRWSNETHRVYLRTGGDWTYASLEDFEDTNVFYLWGKVASDDGMILWWLPDPDKFKALVETGALPGTVEKMKKKKKQVEQPSLFPIVGYTPSGEPIYETGAPGGPSEPFTWALEVPEPTMPPDAGDEELASVNPDTAGSALTMGETGAGMLGSIGDLITLGDLEPAHYELITATSNGVMFAWETPFVLVKESARTDLRYLRAVQKRWMREKGN